MYIISKKKDYYDGVAGSTGIDKTIVYEREMDEIEEKEIPRIFQSKWNGIKTFDVNPFRSLSYHLIKKEYRKIYDENAYFIIGFCGKLYIGWKLYKAVPVVNGNPELQTIITYDIKYVKNILEEKSWRGNLNDSIDYIKSFNSIQIFRDLNVPAFVFDSDYNRTWIDNNVYGRHNPKFFINPILKDYDFGKVFDAFQAFQKIQMFIGGVLGNKEKEIVEVADKYKIAQHGFDKWSFRKEPENGKRN